MTKRIRRLFSVGEELLSKSEEAALTAVKVFNDPLVKFKSETFIVLMNIAWTYLLHAFYRSNGVDYRYFRLNGKRKKYDRTSKGAYKYWELERCLNDENCTIDRNTKNNLKFLIGLRHEIEHQMTLGLDSYLSGRYQACALNYNRYLEKYTEGKHSLTKHLSFSLQFSQISADQLTGPKPEIKIPAIISTFIHEFDGDLTHDEYNSPNYSYRLVFKRKLVNRPGQADRVIEFIDPKSDLAKTIDKEFWVQKQVEKRKFRPSEIVKIVNDSGYPSFKISPHHTDLWQSMNAKEPSKGFGVEVSKQWYWYENWLETVIEHCEENKEKYQ